MNNATFFHLVDSTHCQEDQPSKVKRHFIYAHKRNRADWIVDTHRPVLKTLHNWRFYLFETDYLYFKKPVLVQFFLAN